MANPENLSNNTVFYNALVQGLQRPEVRYGDAHYLDVTLPPEGDYPGATGWVSDYEAYKLQAAEDLTQRQKEAWAAALDTDNPLPYPMGLMPDDRKALLEAGLAYVDIQLADGPNPSTNYTASYSVVRPRDVREDFLPDYIAAAGIERTSEEPFVCDIRRGEHVPDPFTNPHLLALYKYLQTERA